MENGIKGVVRGELILGFERLMVFYKDDIL